jgi:hypothetical protein
MKKTVVEWYFTQLWRAPKDKFMWHRILIKAKEMEKERMIEFANRFYDECGMQYGGLEKSAEQYYNETFNTKEK